MENLTEESSPNYNTITKFLKIIRRYISEYIKYSYKLRQIGGPLEKNPQLPLMKTL